MEGTLGSRCPGDGGDLSHGLWKVGNWSTGKSRPSQAFPAGVWGIRPGTGETGGRQPQSLRARGTALGGLRCFATTHPLGAPQGSGHSQEALSQANGGGRCRESGRRGPRPAGRGQWRHTVPSPASRDKSPQGPGRPPPSGPDHAARLCPPNLPPHLALRCLGTGRQLVAAGGPLRRITPEGHGEAAQAGGEDQKPPQGPLAGQWPGTTGRGSRAASPWLPGSLTPQALIRLQPRAGPGLAGCLTPEAGAARRPLLPLLPARVGGEQDQRAEKTRPSFCPL